MVGTFVGVAVGTPVAGEVVVAVGADGVPVPESVALGVGADWVGAGLVGEGDDDVASELTPPCGSVELGDDRGAACGCVPSPQASAKSTKPIEDVRDE